MSGTNGSDLVSSVETCYSLHSSRTDIAGSGNTLCSGAPIGCACTHCMQLCSRRGSWEQAANANAHIRGIQYNVGHCHSLATVLLPHYVCLQMTAVGYLHWGQHRQTNAPADGYMTGTLYQAFPSEKNEIARISDRESTFQYQHQQFLWEPTHRCQYRYRYRYRYRYHDH